MLSVFGEYVCTLEDTKQAHKVWGETRIPAGTYDLNLRTEGGMNERYKRRYPDMHQGMVWLRQVPLFEFIYIHIGNTPGDTNGCILVGKQRGKDIIYQSKDAYEIIYPVIVGAIKSDEGCRIEVKDE
jgi:hypothetical protein